MTKKLKIRVARQLDEKKNDAVSKKIEYLMDKEGKPQDQAVAIADADKRREVMAKIEKIMVDEGVTIQPYWRSLYRQSREDLHGAEMHIAYLPQWYKWGWKKA